VIAVGVRLRDCRNVLYAVRAHLVGEFNAGDDEERRQPHMRAKSRLIARLDKLIENLKGAV
jgi:hypothetical protein